MLKDKAVWVRLRRAGFVPKRREDTEGLRHGQGVYFEKGPWLLFGQWQKEGQSG